MFSLTSLACAALALAALGQAAITPTSPDGSTVVRAGSTLTALWTADSTGIWNDTQIQLMTGDNFQMVPLKTLATGIDGTTTTTFSTPCPAVSPNAKFYFLQFTRGGDVSTATWTTRFTIAAADGTTSQPTNTTNYSGTDVQWGTGAITDGSASSNSSTPQSGSSASASSSMAASSTSSGLTVYNPAAASSAASVPLSGSAVLSSGVAAVSTASASSTSGSARVSSASSAGAAAATSSRSAASSKVVGAGMGAGLAGMILSLLL